MNSTDDNGGFLPYLSVLTLWPEAYERGPRYTVGLAPSSCSIREQSNRSEPAVAHIEGKLETSVNYEPVRFVQYSQESRQPYIRAEKSPSVVMNLQNSHSELEPSARCSGYLAKTRNKGWS